MSFCLSSTKTTENGRGSSTKPFKIWFSSTDVTLEQSAACEETLTTEIVKTNRTLLGAAALGMVVVKNNALMDCSTQTCTVILYSLSDLKYSSQRSRLSINMYFNKH